MEIWNFLLLLLIHILFVHVNCASLPEKESDECAKLKYIHVNPETMDSECIEVGVFAISQNCRDYFRCDAKLQDYRENCKTQEIFNGTGCVDMNSGNVNGTEYECPQKLCSPPIIETTTTSDLEISTTLSGEVENRNKSEKIKPEQQKENSAPITNYNQIIVLMTIPLLQFNSFLV